jgi:hypothetical protein
MKAQGPWHKGRPTQKMPGAPASQMPGQIPNRLEVIHKNVSDWFYK